MSSKSKTKGNSWEREVANHLSELYKSKFNLVNWSSFNKSLIKYNPFSTKDE